MKLTKKRALIGTAIAVPALVLLAGACWSGANLIAPGTVVAGVNVGGFTSTAAADRIDEHISTTELDVEVSGNTVTVAGSSLGARADTESLAAQALSQHPLWQVGEWNSDAITAELTFDDEKTNTALRELLPDLSTAPVDSTLTFDGTSYVTTPAADGAGPDPKLVQDAFAHAVTGEESAAVVGVVSLVPVLTTEEADAAAATLNTLLTTAGFYVGEERVVAVPADALASWVSVSAEASGFDIVLTPDEKVIENLVADLPSAVNREPSNGTVLVNSAGEVLQETTPSADGRTLGSTDGTAEAFSDQLRSLDGVHTLDVTITPATTLRLERLLEVDISEQRLYLKENGETVDTWLISSGAPSTPTDLGRYNIGWKTPVQTMRGDDYVQPDVRWVAYFNGDEGFHGVYWHDNWGTQMSHGCVGMPNELAQKVYEWAPHGTDVWIHE